MDSLNLVGEVAHECHLRRVFPDFLLEKEITVHIFLGFLFGILFLVHQCLVKVITKPWRSDDRVKHFKVLSIDRLLCQKTLIEQVLDLNLFYQWIDNLLLHLY